MELENDDYRKLIDYAQQAAFKKIWESAYRNHFIEFDDLLKINCFPHEKDIMDNYLRLIKTGYKYIFIVVNPRPEISLGVMRKYMNKCLKKCWIGKHMWQFEQRGDCEENRGIGVHMNALCEVTKIKKLCQMKFEIYNTFKNIVGNKLHVVVKGSHDPKNFWNYMNGIKKGEKKMELVEQDEIWREALGLDRHYGNAIDENSWAPPLVRANDLIN